MKLSLLPCEGSSLSISCLHSREDRRQTLPYFQQRARHVNKVQRDAAHACVDDLEKLQRRPMNVDIEILAKQRKSLKKGMDRD